MSVLFTRRGAAPAGGGGDMVASNLEIGSSVFLKVNGTLKEFLIVHQGLPSSLYDSSCDGTWLLSNEVLTKYQWHRTNDNVYHDSAIHNYLTNTMISWFDKNVQDVIKSVKIPYMTSGSGSILTGSKGLSVKLFLLSCYEVGFTKSYDSDVPQDGAKLNYFDESEYSYKRTPSNGGTWWTRSPDRLVSESAYAIVWNSSNAEFTGDADGYGCMSEMGVRPALILPSNALFDPDTMEFVGIGDSSESGGNEGEVPSVPTEYTVSITNNSKTLMGIEMALVTVNGTTYSPKTMSSGETVTLSVAPGTVVSCMGAGQDDAIFLNGNVVLDSAEGTAQYYNYKVNSNTNIELGYTGYPSGGTVNITTNA